MLRRFDNQFISDMLNAGFFQFRPWTTSRTVYPTLQNLDQDVMGFKTYSWLVVDEVVYHNTIFDTITFYIHLRSEHTTDELYMHMDYDKADNRITQIVCDEYMYANAMRHWRKDD